MATGPTYPTFRRGNRKYNIPLKTGKRLRDAIEETPGSSVEALSYKIRMKAGRINAILECIPEFQELVAKGYVAPPMRGTPPGWASRLTPKQFAKLPVKREEHTQIDVLATTLPQGIHSKAITTDYLEATSVLAKLSRSSTLSPRTRLKLMDQALRPIANIGQQLETALASNEALADADDAKTDHINILTRAIKRDEADRERLNEMIRTQQEQIAALTSKIVEHA